jgi:hypothetical protein
MGRLTTGGIGQMLKERGDARPSSPIFHTPATAHPDRAPLICVGDSGG